jgi:nucleoid DNA-binding protein
MAEEVLMKKKVRKSPKTPKLDLKKPVKVSPAKSLRTKSDVFGTIAEKVGVQRREVAGVFHVLGSLIKADLKAGTGVFKLPGLVKISLQRKPATKARMGINPFTKEEVMFKAKPARTVVKVRPLRGLKEMV